MNITTETVDKLSVPFGFITGPCTVISNLAKLIKDIAKIAYFSFLNRDYEPSEKYFQFKVADLQWEQQVSRQYKPILDSEGFITMESGIFKDPEQFLVINMARGTPPCVDWVLAYKDLSVDDKREIELENLKKELYRHVAFIGIGVIRSIPIIGGAMLSYYEVNKVKTNPVVDPVVHDVMPQTQPDEPAVEKSLFFPEFSDEING